MTRLSDAFERARLAQKKSPDDLPAGLTADDSTREDMLVTWDFDSGGAGSAAEAPQRFVKPPAVIDTKAMRDEPPATPMVTMRRCPGCKNVRGVPARVLGFWERRVLSLMRIRPYRCSSCGHRFHRFKAEDSQPVTDPNEVFSSFLRPEDNRDFKELIGDIAQAEQDQRNRRHRFTSN